MSTLWKLDPATWRPHALHDPERAYTETNCYADILIEVVAAAGLEPTAMLGATVAVDHEHDQWTFFKPPAEDLRALYGIDVHEMQPGRDLAEQIARRLDAGQTLLPELDGFWLPDTAGTSYRTAHVKTSVAAETIDVEGETFRYFHNAGLHELAGEDFRQVFRRAGSDPAVLPPYVDLLRFDDGRPAPDPRSVARDLLAHHLRRRPTTNPFRRFGDALTRDLPALLDGDLADYHAYAFANPRMAGVAFELLGSHVRWLWGPDADPAAVLLDEIVDGTKMLLFRLARRRSFDVAGVVTPMADRWERATSLLDELVG